MSESGDILASVFGPEGPALPESGEYYPNPVTELEVYTNAIGLFADAHSRGGDEAVRLHEQLRAAGASPRFVSYASFQGYIQAQGGIEA